jgi:hypothetical protein
MASREPLEQTSTQPRGGKVMPRWAWWIIFAIPTLFFLMGLGFLADAFIFVSDAQSTRGQVVEISRSYDDEGGVSYTPTIRYRRSDGRAFEAETHIASGNYDYDIGDRVDILYAFNDPEVVRIDSFFSLYGIGLIFTIIGGVFLHILTWVRRKTAGRIVQTGMSAGAAKSLAARKRKKLHMREEHDEPEPQPAPTTTDPSKREHAHTPKPRQSPTVRRMR